MTTEIGTDIATKFRAGKRVIPVSLYVTDKRVFIKFPFNRKLLEEVKALEDSYWHGRIDPETKKMGPKIWSVANTPHNVFQLKYFQSGFANAPFTSPYQWYDKTLVQHPWGQRYNKLHKTLLDPYEHQKHLADHALCYKHVLWAADMGVGKTLSAIMVMEKSGVSPWWWLGPKSALRAVELEFDIWGVKNKPEKMLTYAGLVSIMDSWQDGMVAPMGVVFDESSKIKNSSAQRSRAAMALANGIRADHGENGYIIAMTGTPAPRSPTDWWHQCEVCCPGFLKEGSKIKFEKRLSIVVMEKDEAAGGSYPKRLAWLDNEKKCQVCGEFEEHPCHDLAGDVFDVENLHLYKAAKNEVKFLAERMKGLVLVKTKSECLDLPEKRYQILNCQPSKNTLRAARLLLKTCETTISALTLLRELSDGFQYVKTPTGKETCSLCHGKKEILGYRRKLDWDNESKNPDPNFYAVETVKDGEYEQATIKCPSCKGTGEVIVYSRTTKFIPCPKDTIVLDQLEQHTDIGRLVIYGGFEGSVDRCIKLCHKEQWSTIRCDGRGWQGSLPDGELFGDSANYLKIFQYPDYRETYPRVVFIGQPGAGGMGLTLTASPTMIYYSNTFNGGDRQQSEDRIHRPGADVNRGVTIIDCFHLPTDSYVLRNLSKKRWMQDLSLDRIDTDLAKFEETACEDDSFQSYIYQELD